MPLRSFYLGSQSNTVAAAMGYLGLCGLSDPSTSSSSFSVDQALAMAQLLQNFGTTFSHCRRYQSLAYAALFTEVRAWPAALRQALLTVCSFAKQFVCSVEM
jgi:hypothetical protein